MSSNESYSEEGQESSNQEAISLTRRSVNMQINHHYSPPREELFLGMVEDDPKPKEEEAQAPNRFGGIARFALRNLIFIASLSMLGGGLNYYRAINKPLTYMGSFQLLVEPITQEQSLADPQSFIQDPQPNSGVDYPSQLTILRSPDMLSKISSKVQTQIPKFSVVNLQERFLVNRVQAGGGSTGQTRIIEIIYQGNNPEEVQLVLDAASSVYLSFSLEERRSSLQEGIEFIEQQLPELRARSERVQLAIQQLLQENSIVDPAGDGRDMSTQLNEVSREERATIVEINEKIALKSALQQQIQMTPEEALIASTLTEDPHYQQLVTDLQALEAKIAKESIRFEEKTSIIQSMIKERDTLKNLLEQRESQAIGRNEPLSVDRSKLRTFQSQARSELNRQFIDTVNSLASLQARLQRLQSSKAPLAQRVARIPEITRIYEDLNNQNRAISLTLDQLLSRKEALLIQKTQKRLPWSIVSEPTLLKDENGEVIPLEFDIEKDIAKGLMAGFVASCLLAYLFEKRRDRFFSAQHVSDVTDLPVIVELPPLLNRDQSRIIPLPKIRDVPRLNTPNADKYLPLSNDTRKESFPLTSESFVEAFNSLYGKLILSPEFKTPIRSLAICSSEDNGKNSLVAIHLAKTAEAMGQWTLLVDTNLRNPHIHEYLDVPNKKGLSEMIQKTGSLNFQDYLIRFSKNLYVLTAGHCDSNPSQLLGSRRMRTIMENLGMKFELIIYDTYPLVDHFNDTLFLLPHMDGILLTVDLTNSHVSSTKRTIDVLKHYNFPVYGFVV